MHNVRHALRTASVPAEWRPRSCVVAPSHLRWGAVELVPASDTAAPAHWARTMPRVMLRHDLLGGWGPSRCCSDWGLYTWVADVPRALRDVAALRHDFSEFPAFGINAEC